MFNEKSENARNINYINTNKKILQKIESYTKTYYFKQLENTRTFHKYL